MFFLFAISCLFIVYLLIAYSLIDEDGRMKALAKELFTTQFITTSSGYRLMKICENSMNVITSVAFYKEFMNEDGTLDWDTYRKVVNKSIENAVDRMARAANA